MEPPAMLPALLVAAALLLGGVLAYGLAIQLCVWVPAGPLRS